ncbi:MAG: phosphoribosylanthranilate isomerase [Longimicrobiales bacterium]
MGVRVKICGVCRPADAAAAAHAGADFVGVILAAGFARTRTAEEAEEIYAASSGTKRVGVFVDDDVSAVIAAAERLRLDVVQLHGEEGAEAVVEIRQAGAWAVWKSIRPRAVGELEGLAGRYSVLADGVLVDGWSERGPGGVGARFAWVDISAKRSALDGVQFIAAGGLRAENVGEVVRLLSPDVVDVSSGVEESQGRKSTDLMRAFIATARAASAEVAR